MNSHDSDGALIQWINSFPLRNSIQSLEDLRDGHVLWQILGYIEDEAFSNPLPAHSDSSSARQENLRYILQQAQEVLSINGRHYDEIVQADIESVAQSAPEESVVKFFRLILLIMLDSPRLPELVAKIQSLDTTTQQVMGILMQEMVDWETEPQMPEDDSAEIDAEAKTMSTVRPEQDLRSEIFELEESYARVMSRLEKRDREFRELESKLSKVDEALDRAQSTNDALKKEISRQDDQWSKQQSTRSDRDLSILRDLESKISQQEEIIAGQEADLADAQHRLEDSRRELQRMADSQETSQRLQDELDVLKVDLEKQTRKANTADKYMVKLQAAQAVERERDSLRRDMENAREKLLVLEKLRLEKIALQKSNDEASRTLSQIEREHEELRMTKKQLRVHFDALTEEVETLNSRFAQDQELIAELREKGPTSATSPTAARGGLDGELAASENRSPPAQTNDERLEESEAKSNAKDRELEEMRQALRLAHESAEKSSLDLEHLRKDIEERQKQEEISAQRSSISPFQLTADKHELSFADIIEVVKKRSNDECMKLYDVLGQKLDIGSAKGEASGDAETNAYITNLERELKLMSSAFHNLGRRLQLNNATLLRRSEAPKTWLGKQRKAMEGPVGLTR